MDYTQQIPDYSQFPTQPQSDPAAMLIFWIIYIPFIILMIAGMWKTFVKAGKPGWASIIPIYNLYVLITIAEKPGWWLLLFFIPIANIIAALVVALEVAKRFGRSAIFGIVGLFLFSGIGYLILGFGKSTYKGSTTESKPISPAVPVTKTETTTPAPKEETPTKTETPSPAK